MSKEEITEALKNIKIRCHSKSMKYDTIDFDLDTIEKSLQALEIIKEKNVAVAMLKSCGTVERYNTIAFDEERFKDKNYARKLTEEEFNLLKEVLGE